VDASKNLKVNLQTAIPTGSNVIGGVTQSGTWNVGTVTTVNTVTSLTQWNGTTIDTNSGNKSAGTLRVVLATDQPTMTNAQPVTAPTLTKGTQGANGWSMQALKDAGRTAKRFYATAQASGTTGTETAITLTASSQDSATSTGTSFTPTNGKTFRITNISFATRGHNTATAQATTFSLRMNTAGAVTTTSTPILLQARSATPATANAWDRFTIEIPDGIEIYGDGTKQWGVTANAVFSSNAPTWDVTIIGFEY
jgi:hypothetical protein